MVAFASAGLEIRFEGKLLQDASYIPDALAHHGQVHSLVGIQVEYHHVRFFQIVDAASPGMELQRAHLGFINQPGTIIM